MYVSVTEEAVMYQWWSCLYYIHTSVYNVCGNFVLYSGWCMRDIADWAATLLQMDIKTSCCYAVVEAANRTICPACGELVSFRCFSVTYNNSTYCMKSTRCYMLA